MESTNSSDIERSHTAPAGFNWLWFGPMLVGTIWLAESHVVQLDYAVAKLAIHRWVWAGLLSPSSYFCFSIAIYALIAPLQVAISGVEIFNDASQPRERFWIAILFLVVALILPLIADALIWGSFPFNFDDDGTGRLRLIPFIPWPGGGYMSF